MARRIAVLVVFLLLVGCTGLPGSGTQTPVADGASTEPPYLVFSNGGDETWELSLYVVEGTVDQFRVTFSNGTTRTVEQYAIPAIATRIEPASDVLRRANFTIEPNENRWVNVRGCGPDTHVWHRYSRAGTDAYSYGPAIDCDEYPLLESVTPNGGGTSVGGDYGDLFNDPKTKKRVLAVNGTE